MSNSNYLGQVLSFERRDVAKRDLDLEINEVSDSATRAIWATGSSQTATRAIWATGSAKIATRAIWATGSAGSAKAVVSVAA
jgi:hypothetical protein